MSTVSTIGRLQHGEGRPLRRARARAAVTPVRLLSSACRRSLGYGDVVPSNDVEKIFCVFGMGFGAVVFAYCVTNVSTLIFNMSQVRRRCERAAVGAGRPTADATERTEPAQAWSGAGEHPPPLAEAEEDDCAFGTKS